MRHLTTFILIAQRTSAATVSALAATEASASAATLLQKGAAISNRCWSDTTAAATTAAGYTLWCNRYFSSLNEHYLRMSSAASATNVDSQGRAWHVKCRSPYDYKYKDQKGDSVRFVHLQNPSPNPRFTRLKC